MLDALSWDGYVIIFGTLNMTLYVVMYWLIARTLCLIGIWRTTQENSTTRM
jgi:hypothetical protein